MLNSFQKNHSDIPAERLAEVVDNDRRGSEDGEKAIPLAAPPAKTTNFITKVMAKRRKSVAVKSPIATEGRGVGFAMAPRQNCLLAHLRIKALLLLEGENSYNC